MGKIVIFMGPSASGKDRIIRTLQRDNQYNLKDIVMHTTRPARTGEEHGREYFFDTEDDLHRLEELNQIIECRKYDTVYGPWYYYTSSSNIDLEHNNYITSNTLVGLEQYIAYYGIENIVSILINTDNGVRLTRALESEKREVNPKYEEMCRRFLADCKDYSIENINKSPITAIVNNDGYFDTTYKEVNKILSLNLSKEI